MDVNSQVEELPVLLGGWRQRQSLPRVEALEAVAQAATVFLALSDKKEDLAREVLIADATDVHEEYREAREVLTAALANL